MAEDNPVVGLVETPWTASTTATEGEPTRTDTTMSSSDNNNIGAEGLRRRSTSTSTTSASSSIANEYTTSDAPPSISSKESFPVDNVKSSHDSSLLPRQMQDDYYSCNICFDAAIEPVLTLCGHLYCWPCLHQWLDAQRLNPLCPVCKAGCGSDKVIPVYGRGREATDPRLKRSIPDRPAGQRPLPQSNGMAGTSGANGGWQGNSIWSGMMFQQQLGLAAGLGLLPWQFNWFYMGSPHGRFHGAAGAPTSSQQTFMSRIFFMFGLLFFIAIVLS